jgi:hypothetical protein
VKRKQQPQQAASTWTHRPQSSMHASSKHLGRRAVKEPSRNPRPSRLACSPIAFQYMTQLPRHKPTHGSLSADRTMADLLTAPSLAASTASTPKRPSKAIAGLPASDNLYLFTTTCIYVSMRPSVGRARMSRREPLAGPRCAVLPSPRLRWFRRALRPVCGFGACGWPRLALRAFALWGAFPVAPGSVSGWRAFSSVSLCVKCKMYLCVRRRSKDVANSLLAARHLLRRVMQMTLVDVAMFQSGPRANKTSRRAAARRGALLWPENDAPLQEHRKLSQGRVAAAATRREKDYS